MSRWEQVEKLCQQALELEQSRRAEFLQKACSGDEELLREVESLLRFERHADRFIQQPAAEVAAQMIAHEKPESLVGQQLGAYQILSLLGEGGMGVVYQARDTRLKRLVAIKVLPPDLMMDPERKRRFMREARAASSLNHPHIIIIYDIGHENAIDFIVMEHVSGKTLDQRIPRKGMRLSEALKLAIQMADALGKAHSAGIIHRDLKPGNVMVAEEGQVKILDFGLAKLTEVAEGSGATTRTQQPQTEEGMIVGTVSYMSPEQAEGKKVDARSDIFSFGAVLYEMVSGQKAFQGDSKISTLAAILNKDPKPVTEINRAVPRDLNRIINLCLRKDPGRRFQHMDDLKVELEELKEESASGKLAGTTPAVQPTRWPWAWAAAATVVVGIAITGWLLRGPARRPAAAPKEVPLTSYAGSEKSPSFSPDGNQVVFSWNGDKQDNFDIYLKQIGSPTAERLTTDPAEDLSPAFSPDGRSIGFIRVSKERASLIIIPAIGGPESIVAEVAPAPDLHTLGPSFAWFPDGKSVVTDGLTLLSTETGERRGLTSPPTRSSVDSSPAVSPDGRTLAFRRWTGYNNTEIYLLDLTEDLKPKGVPRRLAAQRDRDSVCPAWTANGREIIFASGAYGSSGESPHLWKAPAFDAGEPEQLTFTEAVPSWPTISRSGNRLAYQRNVSDGNVWRLPLIGPGMASGAPVRITTSTRNDSNAQYSGDGKRIAFESDRSGVQRIWVSDSDGSNAHKLFSQPGVLGGDPRWSPDGERIAFSSSDREGNFEIYAIRASGGQPIQLTTDPRDDITPSWSGDGNWVYFASSRSGRHEIWRVSAGGGKAEQVTRNGGETAFESPDGKFVYYLKAYFSSALWKMPLSGGQESQVLPSVVWRAFTLVKEGIYFIPESGADGEFSIHFLSFATGKAKTVAPMSGPPAEGLSVSPDGHYLLFSQQDEAGSDLMLVENFR